MEERISSLVQMIKNLMNTTGWSAEQTMDNMKVSDSDRRILDSFF